MAAEAIPETPEPEVKVTFDVPAVNVPEREIGVPVPEKVYVLDPAENVCDAPMVRVPLTVTPPAPVAVVVEEAPVKERLLKVQPVAPPKPVPLAPSTVKVPPVILIVPSPVTSPPDTVTSWVPDRVPAVTVRSLAIESAWPLVWNVPPLPLRTRL